MSEKQIKIIEKFIQVHKDTYDYSLVEYKTTKDKVIIICKLHGEFQQSPEKHIHRKQGCPVCASFKSKNIQIKSQETVLQQFIETHGSRYDYSLVNYTGAHVKVDILCKEHGVFKQTPNSHVKGSNCPLCANQAAKDTLESFLQKLPEPFKNKYDFSKVLYIDSVTKVEVICKDHGVFKTIPRSLLRGHGCKKCANVVVGSKNKLKPSDILLKANIVHDNKYIYSPIIDYKSNKDLLDITCPFHGIFKQAVVSHLRGQGCPTCAKELYRSKAEKDLVKFITSFGYKVLINYRPIWLNGLEIDIYIPLLNLAIEYNGGAYHHSSFDSDVNFYNCSAKPEDYHKNKYEKCKQNQVDLIHIFDFEDLIAWKQDLKLYLENKNNYIIKYEHTTRVYSPRKDVNLTVYGRTKIIKLSEI